MAKEEESEDDGPFQFLDTVLTEETDEYQENGMDENCIKKEFDDSWKRDYFFTRLRICYISKLILIWTQSFERKRDPNPSTP